MDRWNNRKKGRRLDGSLERMADSRMEGWMDRWEDRKIEAQENRRMNGRNDGKMQDSLKLYSLLPSGFS